MSHLHLQIEGLSCNNCTFYTSRALTPEANVVLPGAEEALSPELKQASGFIRHVPLDVFEVTFNTSENQSLHM